MAHDDMWLPDHLELLEPFFKDDAIEIAYSRPLWVSPEGHVIPLSFNLHDPEVLEDFLYQRHNALPAACFVYRSRCLERYGTWDETLPAAADWDLWARIIEGSGRNNFAYLPTPTCLHFQAIWRTEANAGPGDLLTWRYRTENGLPGAALSMPVDDFPTEQAAFASRLQAEPASFTRDIRIGSQRVLDRIVMANDRDAFPLLQQLRIQEEEIRRCNSRLGVFEYTALEPDAGIIFGPGFYPDEGGARWMWREAQMFLLINSGAAKARLTLQCDRAPHYDQFPLIVDVAVNGRSAESLIFKSSHKKHKVDLTLDRFVNKVDFMSSAAFVPEQCGINNDSRELSLLLTRLRIKAGKRASVKRVHADDDGLALNASRETG